MTGTTIAVGLIEECNTFFYPATIPIEPKTCLVVRYAINLSLLLALLLPIPLARSLSNSRIITLLWGFTFASYIAALIYLYQKHSPIVFIQALGAGYKGFQPHLSWHNGFYFGCAAVVTHLIGMIVAYFSFDRNK